MFLCYQFHWRKICVVCIVLIKCTLCTYARVHNYINLSHHLLCCHKIAVFLVLFYRCIRSVLIGPFFLVFLTMELPLNWLVYFLCFSILSLDFACIRFCLPGISNFSKWTHIQVFDSFLAVFLLVLVCLHHITLFLVHSLCFRRFKSYKHTETYKHL